MGWTSFITLTETIEVISVDSPCPCTSTSAEAILTTTSCLTQPPTVLPAPITSTDELGSHLLSTSFTTITFAPNPNDPTQTGASVQTLALETAPAQSTPSTIKVSSTNLSITYIIIISVVSGVTFLLVAFVVYRVLIVQSKGQTKLSIRRRDDDDDWRFRRFRRFDPPPGGPNIDLRPYRRNRYDYDYLEDLDIRRIRRDPPDYPMTYQAYSGPGPRPSGGGNAIDYEDIERGVYFGRGRWPRRGPSVDPTTRQRPSGPQPRPGGDDSAIIAGQGVTGRQRRSQRDNERTTGRFNRDVLEGERPHELPHMARQQWTERRGHGSRRSSQQHSTPSPHPNVHVLPPNLVQSPPRVYNTPPGPTFIPRRTQNVHAGPSLQERSPDTLPLVSAETQFS